MRAIVIRPGDLPVVEDVDGFDGIREAIGGWVEAVRCGVRDTCVLVDEDGRMKQLPLNHFASMFVGYPLLGTAVIVGSGGEDFGDVPEATVSRVFPGEKEQ